MNILIISNNKAGLEDKSHTYAAHIAELTTSHTIRQVAIEDATNSKTLNQVMTELNPTTVLAIGGDGTVSFCAGIARTHNLTLGIIPAGTFNHFAKHIGIPRDIAESFEVFTERQSRLVDIGLVNDTPFVNLASVGFYAELVKNRERLQNSGLTKWLSFASSLMTTRLFPRTLRITTKSNHAVNKRSVMAFVGNGTYTFGSSDMLNTRQDIEAGKLQLILLRDYRRVTLFLLMLVSLVVDIKHRLGVSSVLLTEFTLQTKRAKLTVVIDGEVRTITTPLTFSKESQALRVICPPTTAGS